MPRGMGRGRGAVEKPKDFGGVMKKLVKFCSRYIPVMIFALVLGAAGTVCQIIGPDKLKDMTNEITKGLPAMVHGKPVMNSIDMDAVSRIAWLLVALYVGYALLSYLQSWLMANVTQRTAQQLREAISQKINRLPLKYFDKVSYGDVLSRITNDVDAIGQTLGQSVGSLITSITLFFGALIMMFYNNVIMTLCAIGSALLGLIIMGVIMKVSQKYFTRQQVALGDVNGHVEEMYTGHTVVKAYCGEERSIEQFEKYNKDLYVSGWKSQFLSGLMMPIMNFVGNFGYVVVCVVGAALAMDGKIEFGVIVAFMMYIRLFTQPLSQFAQAFQNLQRCAAASERVFGFLDEPELADETGKPIKQFGADAVRYWAAAARLGLDATYDEGQMKIGRRLAIKLLNATKFALAIGREDENHHVAEAATATWNPADVTEPLDRAAMAKMALVVREATAALNSYEHSKALEAIEDYFWQFCDDYIELVKNRAYGTADATGNVPSETAVKSARTALGLGLDAFARLLAPFLPYAAEEVWSWMHEGEGSVHRAAWPVADVYAAAAGDASADLLAHAGEALAALRGIKSKAKVSMKTPILSVTLAVADDVRGSIEAALGDIAEAGRVTGPIAFTAPAAAEGENEAADVTVAESELGEPPAKKPKK